MRIRAIRGRGLASLGGDFEVDLDAPLLRASGVFVIGGPTGAGKSTILDAMCLALFDRAPRLARASRDDGPRAPRPGGGRRPVGTDAGGSEREDADGDAIRASDPRSLVRRGATQAFAEVDFEGRRGGAYRARWEVRSVRRRDGSRGLAKQSMSLTVLSAASEPAAPAGLRLGTTKTQVLDEIESRLGLDFAQFCRSVLLPQGELASFLEAPDDERARLLERITGTEIYSTLSRVVHERASLLAREARDRSLELQSLPLLEPAERASLVERRADATLSVARAVKRLADVARSERIHEETLLHATELAQAERTADELGRQLGLWESRRDDVDRARRLRELRAEREAVRELELGLARSRQDEAALAAQLASASRELEAAERAIALERERLATLTRDAEAVERALAAHEEALGRLGVLAGTDDAQRASARRAELAEREAHERERDAQKRVAAFERELAEIDRQLGPSGDGPALEPLARLLRHELRAGEPCSVCGATEHPALGRDPGSRDPGSGAGREGSVSHRDAVGLARELDARRQALARREALRLDAGRAQALLGSRREEHARAVRARDEASEVARASAEARERLRAAIVLEHGEASPTSRRSAHARALEALRARLEASMRDRADRVAATERLIGRAAGAAERVAELEATLLRRREALGSGLEARGLTAADLVRAGALADDEVERWAAEIAQLDERRARQAAVVEERRRRVEEHRETAPRDLVPAGDVALARREAERERETAERERAIADARLAEDDARRAERERRAAALVALQAEADTWEALGRLVGSADGKKLRVIVQSMALDALVAHANEQLRVLAPRYTLSRRGRGSGSTSLALDVIDGELEGSVRATSSLSGGERFLVSLALALGLGTMGAERDDVGSLFIDEGFGSLDEESLEQALEALDALRQAGRQIGVVSHVARLAERFDVRVEVTPTEAGASVVRVRTG